MKPFHKTQSNYFPVVSILVFASFFGFFCYNQYAETIPFPDFKQQEPFQESSNSTNIRLQEAKKDDNGDSERIISPLEECDIFTGEWVFDNGSSHPLYKEQDYPPSMRDGTAVPLLKLESISKKGENWKNVDYLIFNTYIWWRRRSFDDGATGYVDVDQNIAYEVALKSWAKWVEENVDPNQTSVFFSSMSPMHNKGSDWNNTNAIKCSNETTPILNMSTFDVGTNPKLFVTAVNAIQSMKVPVRFLNITRLSEYRKVGHTSIYAASGGKLLTREQKADPARYADCLHWCLPGLPDTWNELLYTLIINKT
ncbi:Protein ESKIMO 1 [Hibiscus syriacus]|uniref:Protein ESKIMO 1 n=1 Tax=Hibiscus syriacus TaxID=106335 RepID=A0A6A3C181_HIBSY|nr:Protein ESKIMO 1 [Hibiscus syriacus]